VCVCERERERERVCVMNLILFLREELEKAKKQQQQAQQQQRKHDETSLVGKSKIDTSNSNHHLLGAVVAPLVRAHAAQVEQGVSFGVVTEGCKVISLASGAKSNTKGRVGIVVRMFEEWGQIWCMVRFDDQNPVRFKREEVRPCSSSSSSSSSTEITETKQRTHGADDKKKKDHDKQIKAKSTATATATNTSSSSSSTYTNYDADEFFGVVLRLPAISDPRASHVLNVIKSQQGASLRVGIVGGGIGYATVRIIEEKGEDNDDQDQQQSHHNMHDKDSHDAKANRNKKTNNPDNSTVSIAAEEQQQVQEQEWPTKRQRTAEKRTSSDTKGGSNNSNEEDGSNESHSHQNHKHKRHKKTRKQKALQKEANKKKKNKSQKDCRVLLVTFGKLELPPPTPKIHIILAHPRPKVLAKLWSVVSQLGVEQIVVINANRTDKQYWYSDKSSLKHHLRMPLLLEGMQQGGHTTMPAVHVERFFKPFLEDKLDHIIPKHSVRLLCDLGTHPYLRDLVTNSKGAHTEPSIVLAIGPEGGWTQYEVDCFKAKGFQSVSLGSVIMRVDVACIAAVSIATDQLMYLKKEAKRAGNNDLDDDGSKLAVGGTGSAAVDKRNAAAAGPRNG